jgi:phage terminase large subunit GpA-like protein
LSKQKTNQYVESFSEGLKPDPVYTVSEWADRFRILPSKGAAEPGRYRTARAPFLKDIMDDLSPNSPVKRVVFMKSSQVGGTELGINWLGYVVHMCPAPMMIVQPTIELAERFSKQRIAPMIDETPELRALIAPVRTRDSGNSILLKEFRGGVLIISGSNSATSLRSMPIRFLFCDEVSAYEKDVGNEGDPVSLAEKRTQTFATRLKIFLNSTPTIKDTCRIESEYLKTDQRRFYVPCPLCKHMQWLKWPNLKWDDGDPNTVKYQCEACGDRFEEFHKTKFLAAGEWRATSPGDPEVRGYHISALYSPLGWKSWREIVKEFLESKHDATMLKTFVNTILGETFEEEYAAKVGAEGLRERAETFEPNMAPAKSFVITAGIDVQDDRLEVSLYAWGRDEESWTVSHLKIFGDPSLKEVWKQLDSVLFATYRHELGGEIKISAAGIDSGGHHTHEVYQYVRDRRGKGIIAVKGQSQKGKPAIGKPTKQDVNFRGQSLKYGVDLYPVGTDTIKSVLYGRMKHNEPGPGYIHFNAALDEEFFKQITSEKQITRYVKGFAIREWVKKSGARNEALDCAVYAYAALQYLYTRYNRAKIWDQLEKMLPSNKNAQQKKPDSNEDSEKAISENDPDERLKKEINARKMNINRRSKGFVSGY